MSKSTAEFVIKARQMPPERVKVVYLGVPLEEFSRTRTLEEIAAARHELGVAPDEFLVGSVTRLHDSKGNSYLVEAAQKVLQQRPKTRFVVFGEGPLRPELEAQARALGLGDRFAFTGFARDVARVVSAFDVSVFPSLWEGTPLTVFEALAMGKPIVATDADGLVDVLTHERDAVIVPKRDADALAAGLVRLIDSPEDRARLSVHARVTGRQYDIAAFVRKMERLYDLLHEVSRKTKRRGRAAGGSVVPARDGATRVTLRPGLILAAVFLCVYGTFALVVNLPQGDERVQERRSHLLHDGSEPGPRRGPDVSERRPDARLARVPWRARPVCS